MLLVIVLANLDVGWCWGRLQSVRGNVILVGGDERKRQRRSEGRGGGEEKASILRLSATVSKDVLTTHGLALLHETRPTCSNGEWPDSADSGLTGALLPQLLARSRSSKLSTKLTPLQPYELPHLLFSEAD